MGRDKKTLPKTPCDSGFILIPHNTWCLIISVAENLFGSYHFPMKLGWFPTSHCADEVG